ncbi:trypsin-like serine protease with C-terminal PDZ domain [Halobacteroides halobius DSM 5150]|uniref:Trypsin-like serine protease with C-terminal PDZ domain n=1 Tax=Halobacteroides halobius (strain ATCC 35273 / DSM 5150 / MD-1) TaxID=748449 RepID=L0KBQ5_HALHC|nr:trypsin-like peptidase domain-containing protein [Halobacteroides halobius]AGB42441.1 trypsin-like serine protease with C-terminal PDZ domain [Halobacteroides halobius DSM 5150]
MDSLFTDRKYSGLKVYLLLVVIALLLGGGLIYFISLQQTHSQQEVKSNQETKTVKVESHRLSKEDAIITVVDKVAPAIVKITTKKEKIVSDFFAWQTKRTVKGQGSGVIIDQDGYIVTNNHVIDQADQIKVILSDGDKSYQGKIVGRDPVTDLAVIKINPGSEKLPVVKIGNSNNLEVGQLAIAIGNPYGFSETVTTGVISALGRQIQLQKSTGLINMIQTDAAINPGNSGGALLNSQGEVIGINTAIIEQAQGIGFAIPINVVKEITKELIAKGEVVRPWLGIYASSINSKLAKEYDLAVKHGVYIFNVIEGSPAFKVNLQNGDIITKIDQKIITSMARLKDILQEYQVNDKINLTIYRAGKKKEISVKLAKMPQDY